MKYKDIFAFVVIGVFALTLFRSIFYGISTPDESFYLTIPYRVIKGDALLLDEWHASQLSAFLLYLPMKLFLLINKSTDGIILYFRFLFAISQTAVSCYTYYKLKKFGTLPALISAVIFLLYVPETVKMLDYYTMSIMGFQVVTLMLFFTEKIKIHHLLFSGIVFACAVVAQPFNCMIFFIYTIAVLVKTAINRKKDKLENGSKYLSVKAWGYITLGITIVAVIFFVFMLSQMSPSELIHNVKNLFSGEDHKNPITAGETDMFSYKWIFITLYHFTPISLIVSAAFLVLLFADRNRVKRRVFWICILFAVTVFMVAELAMTSRSNIEATLFRPYVPFILTVACILLTKNKDKGLCALVISGIAYVVFLGVISQALDYVGVIGLVISNTALAPAAKRLNDEIQNEKKSKKKTSTFLKSVICVLIVFVVGFDLLSGTLINLMDDTMAISMGRPNLQAEAILDDGPLKGIRTNKEIAKSYNDILSDTKEIKNNSCEKVLVAGLIPWIYFCFDDTPATFTTWSIFIEVYMYEEYYRESDHLPECVYVPETLFYWGGSSFLKDAEYREIFSQMFSEDFIEGKSGDMLYTGK